MKHWPFSFISTIIVYFGKIDTLITASKLSFKFWLKKQQLSINYFLDFFTFNFTFSSRKINNLFGVTKLQVH